MDRINDPPPTGGDTLTGNDHSILGAPGQNPASQEEQADILGGAPQASGTAASDTSNVSADKSETGEMATPEMPMDGGEPTGGRLDSDTVGTDSPHTDTGAGSNLTDVGGSPS